MPASAKKLPALASLSSISPLTRTLVDRLAREPSLTMERLAQLLPEDLSADEMDELFLAMSELGLQLTDDKKPSKLACKSATPIVAAPTAPPPAPPAAKDASTRLPGVVSQYMAEISEIPNLTATEEAALSRRVGEGDSRAANVLVESHLRLVVKIANEYRHTKMPKMDLIQAGNLGLLDAARRYRPEKQGRFAHFASWWVRQAITRHVEAAGLLIRLPRTVVKEIHVLGRQRARMRSALKREPLEQEVADALGWPVSKVEYLSSAGHDPLSLDSPLPREEEKSLEEVVVDPKAAEQVRVARRRIDAASVRPLMTELSPQERSVLALRYGLQDDVARPVNEVAEITSLSPAEVRRLEREGLEKLQRLSRADKSMAYEDDD